MEIQPELKLQRVQEEYYRKDRMGIPMSVRESYWTRISKLKEKVREKAHREKLGQILLEKKLVTDDQLKEALTEQTEKGKDKLIGEVLLEKGLIDEKQLKEVVKEQVLKNGNGTR